MNVLLAFVLGCIAGMRTMSAPTTIAWAARFGLLDLAGSWLRFFALPWMPWLLTLLAIGELIGDKLPTAPSRKIPGAFGARILSGSVSGAALGASAGSLVAGLLAGGLGAIAGTLGGYAFRMRLADRFGRDLPAALVEDAIVIGTALVVILLLQ